MKWLKEIIAWLIPIIVFAAFFGMLAQSLQNQEEIIRNQHVGNHNQRIMECKLNQGTNCGKLESL